jgi:hypothetical protein
MTHRLREIGLALFMAGCASAPMQKSYIAPTNETIQSETQEGDGERPTHTIYVINRSTVPVTVFGVHLSACENIKQRCDARTVNIKLTPGQRAVAARVEPNSLDRAWNYRFGFSWRADSAGIAAVRALADGGDPDAQRRLAATERADSLRRLGAGYRELTRDEHLALRDRVASMRAEPESLVLTPGERADIESVRLLLVDREGNLLGRTRWVRFQFPPARVVQANPSANGVALVGLKPGRATVHYALADEAQAIYPTPVRDVEVPIVVRYNFDEHSPTFTGTVADADSKVPLRCAAVSLEDTASRVVSRVRSDGAGGFTLRAPRAGTYRVRVDLDGWSPFVGPNETAAPDDKKQSDYAVRFAEQIMSIRPVGIMSADDDDRARLTGAAAPQVRAGAPPGQMMRLGGSAAMPIVEIITTRVPPSSSWVQFAVSDAAKLDSASVVFPAGTSANAKAVITRTLPQLRFSAAREEGKNVCDVIRVMLTFSPR